MPQTIDTGYQPRAFQAEIHRNLKRFSVLVCHRRFGKTVLSINALVDASLRLKKERPRYGYVAPLYSQAKSIAWDYLRYYTQSIPGIKKNESELWVELPNGAKIRLFGADNPDALRGMYFDGVVLDEVAQMKPEVWGEIIRPALTDREGWALFIGTPKGMNLFSELYYSACKSEDWYAGFFPASKTKALPPAELEEARATMSDNQYRQEFECDFSASTEDRLITIDVVNAAIAREYQLPAYVHSPKILGIDVARFGDDKSTFIYRQGCVAYGLKKFRNLDTMQFSGLIAQEIDKGRPEAVFIDVVGVGAGVVDRLKQLGYKVTGVNAGAQALNESIHSNLRAEMWCKCRDWLKDFGQIPDDLELKNDLVSPMYQFDGRNRYVLEKKSDMKKRGLMSPDCAESLILTFAYPVRAKTDYERVQERYAVGQDYDPLHEYRR